MNSVCIKYFKVRLKTLSCVLSRCLCQLSPKSRLPHPRYLAILQDAPPPNLTEAKVKIDEKFKQSMGCATQ